MRLFCTISAAVLLCNCGGASNDPVRTYARLAVALGERDAASLDYYYGPAEWVADVRAKPPALAEISREAQSLSDSTADEHLKKQLLAVATRARQLTGARLSFDEEAAALFDVPAWKAADPGELEKARQAIAALLPGKEPLSSRLDQAEQRWTVPAQRYEAVMNAAVEACRSRSAKGMGLPASERIRFEWVGDKPWNAFSLYQGKFQSRVQWNADFPVTVDRALQLACHETYPGHHTQSAYLESSGKSPLLVVQPAFSPQSFVSEALASYAADLVFTPEEREHFEREVLYPLAGLDPAETSTALRVSRELETLELAQAEIAREFVDGRLEFLRAAEQLRQMALMERAEATLKYMNEYRSYLLGYTVGKSMVRECFQRASRGSRWQLLRSILLGETTLTSCGPR